MATNNHRGEGSALLFNLCSQGFSIKNQEGRKRPVTYTLANRQVLLLFCGGWGGGRLGGSKVSCLITKMNKPHYQTTQPKICTVCAFVFVIKLSTVRSTIFKNQASDRFNVQYIDQLSFLSLHSRSGNDKTHFSLYCTSRYFKVSSKTLTSEIAIDLRLPTPPSRFFIGKLSWKRGCVFILNFRDKAVLLPFFALPRKKKRTPDRRLFWTRLNCKLKRYRMNRQTKFCSLFSLQTKTSQNVLPWMYSKF